LTLNKTLAAVKHAPIELGTVVLVIASRVILEGRRDLAVLAAEALVVQLDLGANVGGQPPVVESYSALQERRRTCSSAADSANALANPGMSSGSSVAYIAA
jgi:hypothetical protein